MKEYRSEIDPSHTRLSGQINKTIFEIENLFRAGQPEEKKSEIMEKVDQVCALLPSTSETVQVQTVKALVHYLVQLNETERINTILPLVKDHKELSKLKNRYLL